MTKGRRRGPRGPRKRKPRPNRGITRDEHLMHRVVVSVFRHGGVPSFRAIGKVAEDLGRSPQSITSIIRKAFAKGHFSLLVHLPTEVIEVDRLEPAVLERYPRLRKVLLVPGKPEILGDLDPKLQWRLQGEVLQALAARVAEHLDARIGAAAAAERDPNAPAGEPDFILGVAWGVTLRLIANHLSTTPRPIHLPGLQVVPIVAPTAAFRSDPIEAGQIARDIAQAYGGTSGQLLCPAIVTAEQAAYLRTQLEDVRKMLGIIGTADMVVTGLGPIPLDDEGGEINISNDPVRNREMIAEARKADSIGEICGWLFGSDGQICQAALESMGLGLDGLRRIAQDDAGEVVLVTGGDRRRFEPLRVALEAGFASVLVTDTVTARYLVGELHMVRNGKPQR